MPAAAARPAESFDELTLRRAQRGDEPAWRALIDRYQAPVHAVIWRLLAGRQLDRVEDLVQETFVRVLRALPAFEPSGPATLATWILTIATRLALNELRRPEHAELVDEPVAARGDRADDRADRRRLAAAIQAAVAALPEAQRAVFVLREYHDLDYSEIAAALEHVKVASGGQTVNVAAGGRVEVKPGVPAREVREVATAAPGEGGAGGHAASASAEEGRTIAPTELEAHRLKGNKQVMPDSYEQRAMQSAHEDRVIAAIKLCVDTTGAVSQVRILRSSGYPGYDQKIASEVNAWGFRPIEIDGKAVAVCTALSFIYSQK